MEGNNLMLMAKFIKGASGYERDFKVTKPYYPERIAESGDTFKDGYRDTAKLSQGGSP